MPRGKGHTPGRDAEKDDAWRIGTVECGLLDDFVSDAGNGAAYVGRGHQFPVGVRRVGGAQATKTSFSASLDGSLKDVELSGSLAPVGEAVVSDTNVAQ